MTYSSDDMIQPALSYDVSFNACPLFNSAYYQYQGEEEEQEEEEEEQEPNWVRRRKSIFAWQDDRDAINGGIASADSDKNDPSEEATEFTCKDKFAAENYLENDAWSICDSLFGNGGETACSKSSYDREITREPEYAVYECIFGYWPCFYKADPKHHTTI